MTTAVLQKKAVSAVDFRFQGGANKLMAINGAGYLGGDVAFAAFACNNYPTAGELETEKGKQKFISRFGTLVPFKSYEQCQKEAWSIWNRPHDFYAFLALDCLKYGLGEAASDKISRMLVKKYGKKWAEGVAKKFGHIATQEFDWETAGIQKNGKKIKPKVLAKYSLRAGQRLAGKTLGMSIARGAARVGAKIAMKAGMGVVGWILMIADLVSMGVDMADPMGLNTVLSPTGSKDPKKKGKVAPSIREIRESTLKGNIDIYKKENQEFPQEVPVEYPILVPGGLGQWADQDLFDEYMALEQEYLDKNDYCMDMNPWTGQCNDYAEDIPDDPADSAALGLDRPLQSPLDFEYTDEEKQIAARLEDFTKSLLDRMGSDTLTDNTELMGDNIDELIKALDLKNIKNVPYVPDEPIDIGGVLAKKEDQERQKKQLYFIIIVILFVIILAFFGFLFLI